jgi:hypothetical protein
MRVTVVVSAEIDPANVSSTEITIWVLSTGDAELGVTDVTEGEPSEQVTVSVDS